LKIGAHIKSAGGIENVFDRAAAMGAEAVQLFLSAPQQWRPPSFTEEQVAAFNSAREASGLPVFLHAVYLINLASDDPALLERSVRSLAQYLNWGARLGAVGTIFHVGSHKGAGFEGALQQICRLMGETLAGSSRDSLLIMENNAGQGGGVGSTFKELGALVRGLDNDPRVRICIDTCHAFAMGYDIASREGINRTMEEFSREIGLDRLVAVHANDSKMPLGGVRDRHANIGDGYIGYDGFRSILAHPSFANVPFLLEVPGIDGSGPDKENIQRLKTIREETRVAASPSGQ
jgi:deoxyribonuclease IV